MPLITHIYIYIYLYYIQINQPILSNHCSWRPIVSMTHKGLVGGSKNWFSMAEQKLFNPETVFFHSRNASVELPHWICALRKVLSCQIDRFGEKFPRNQCWHRCLPLCPDGCQCLPQWGFFLHLDSRHEKTVCATCPWTAWSSQHFLKRESANCSVMSQGFLEMGSKFGLHLRLGERSAVNSLQS